MPVELDEVERRIMQLEIEAEALRKEQDKASVERLGKLEKELADLKEERTRLAGHWQQEKDAIQEARRLKEEQEQLRHEVEQAQRAGDYAKASELQYGRIPEIDRRIQAAEARLADLQAHQRMLKEEVDEEDIAEVVSKWTGIPVSRLMEGEIQKLVRMEERLHQRVVGQDAGDHGRRERDSTRAGRAAGSEPPARQLHLPGPDRRRQDGAGAGARRVPVRLRPGDDPDRHVRVPGEAHGLAPDRRAARLRRLRGGRAADRGRPPAPVRGRAVRRDREGASGGAERPAPAARRRPVDGRQGSDGRLQEHGRHHDVEPREPRDRGAVGARCHGTGRGNDATGDGGAAGALPAGVPEPGRRDRSSSTRSAGATWSRSSTSSCAGCSSGSRRGRSRWS